MTGPITSPRRDISSEIYSDYMQQHSQVFLPVLLDIMHPEIVWRNQDGDESTWQETGHLRVVNDIRGVKYKGDDLSAKYYSPCTFSIKLPKDDGKSKGTASLSISCIDVRVIEVIRSVTEDLTCRVVALFAKQKTNDTGDGYTYVFSKQYGKKFSMNGVTWEGTTATWSLDPDAVMDLNVPRDMTSSFRVPGASND